MKKLLEYYNFIVATIFVALALFNARSFPELITGVAFSPLFIYFTILVLPRKNLAPLIEKEATGNQKSSDNEQPLIKLPKLDVDRRIFLKIIASGGISLFLLSLFTGKAQKALLGSPASTNPTAAKDIVDGYQIAEIDDSTPTFYGYTNTDGAWFIRKEEESGSFRYTKGAKDFSGNWENRASLSYDYFEKVF